MNRQYYILVKAYRLIKNPVVIIVALLFFNIQVFAVEPCFDEKVEKELRIKDCKIKAEQGNAKAQYHLADKYHNATSSREDAFIWAEKSANQGYIPAQLLLAREYKYKIEGKSKSAQWYLKAAEQGDVIGQFELGNMYYYGEGVPQDYKQALKWYQKAAEQGNSRGQYGVGKAYYDGIVVEQDYKKAFELMAPAVGFFQADAKIAVARMYKNGWGVSPDYIKSYAHFYSLSVSTDYVDIVGNNIHSDIIELSKKMTASQIKQAEILAYEELVRTGKFFDNSQGGAFPYWVVAEIYQKQGRNTLRTSPLYLRAAERGSRDAQRLVVEMFWQGDVFDEIDEVENKNYLDLQKEKAERGNTEAQLNLAYMHFHGKQTPQNKQKTLHWYKQAAKLKQGEDYNGFNVMAMYLVAWMYDTAQGIPQDYQQAFEWYQKAANAGYGDAQLRLAQLYQQGQGVEQDKQQAIQWITTAAQQGYNKAQRILADHYRAGTLVEQNKQHAFDWYKQAAVLEDTQAQYALAQMYSTGEGTEKDNIKAYILSAYLAENYDHVDAKILCKQLENKLSQAAELKQANELGKQWQTDAKYRTLGVAVEPPFDW